MSGIKRTQREIIAERRAALASAAQERATRLQTEIARSLQELGSALGQASSSKGDLQQGIGELRQAVSSSLSKGAVTDANLELAHMQHELRLLQTEFAPHAYASIAALEKQGYRLKETATGQQLQAWFEEQGNPAHKILLTISPQKEEGLSWLEQLDMSGFGDQCLEPLDLYDAELVSMGIRKKSRVIVKPDDSSQRIRPRSTRRERQTERG